MSIVSVYLYLDRGWTINISSGLSIGAWFISFFFKDPLGKALTDLSAKLMDKYQDTSNPGMLALTEFFVGMNQSFAGNYKLYVSHMEKSMKTALYHGELVFACYAMDNYSAMTSMNGDHIPSILPKFKSFLEV